MEQIKATCAVAALIAMIGVSGNWDYEDDLRSEAVYCERLALEIHADWLNIKEACDARH
jgi:hypothetical protein